MIRLILIIYPGGGAHGVRAVTSGPLYRLLLGFECRKNVIGVPNSKRVAMGDRSGCCKRAAVAMANHSLGRWPFAGVQEIFPGRYVCPGEAERVYISILTEAQVLSRRFASAACK